MPTIGTLLVRLAERHERARDRRLLVDMDARVLRDIGLGREEVVAEASRFWWRV
ncbi:DUF1127 domain-containing protein [Neoroseomonas soli]|uniref:DUF1127 domain-containing protein n=1 Tax=Neoroseomonas soli TaxID=1081025 RepID=A0A9X9X1G3_9PROT|nr:DUF1127 domain-containing protein [Neoroseomonas soli]MBR0673242.1 DUF1127 domain-containing protein [Neoroseomonas soli]